MLVSTHCEVLSAMTFPMAGEMYVSNTAYAANIPRVYMMNANTKRPKRRLRSSFD